MSYVGQHPLQTHLVTLHSLANEGYNTILFGKYKNKLNWITIYNTDKPYCKWILKQTPTHLHFLLFKQFIERMNFIR